VVRVEDEMRAPPVSADGPGEPEGALLAASFDDLAEDLLGLEYIVRSSRDRMSLALAELQEARDHLAAETFGMLQDQARELRARSATSLNELVALGSIAGRGDVSRELLGQLTERKHVHQELVRTQAGLMAAIATATDWQSPSFAHSVRSQAGRLTGRITEHHDDYKRDRHADAAAYERAYLREYVADPSRLELRALLTSCGMAAFTTILGFLEMEGKLDGPVVAGRSLYHECKQLLRRSRAADRIVWVDEHDLPEQLRAVADHRPSAFFMDSFCNAKGIAVPDLTRLITSLARGARHQLFLVIDNTGLSCAFQPFALLRPSPRGLRLLVFESLTKYAQLGLDRTPAGMIVAEGADVAVTLDGYREHLGTNAPDIAAQALPVPDRVTYAKRLARLDRNSFLLATAVQRRADTLSDGVFAGARYPGLPNHPAFGWAGRSWFRGGFFEIAFEERPEELELQHRFLELVLEEARTRRVPLAAGASFGLGTTRIYHTAATSAFGEPFVRISPGTEHRLDVEGVARCLEAAMDRLAREARGLARFPVPG
jgi:cystathionine beta-lyase/cystathionine gamma-synthase